MTLREKEETGILKRRNSLHLCKTCFGRGYGLVARTNPVLDWVFS
jgi:hypothetical protein